jgi:hypothetical protein
MDSQILTQWNNVQDNISSTTTPTIADSLTNQLNQLHLSSSIFPEVHISSFLSQYSYLTKTTFCSLIHSIRHFSVTLKQQHL